MRRSAVTLALIASAISATPSALASQTQPHARTAVYGELLGSGGVASINIERRVNTLRLRIGYGGWTISDGFGAGSTKYSTLPITVSQVRGDGNHHLETGGGITFGREAFRSAFDGSEDTSHFTTLTGLIGYRYQKPNSGFIFRAAFTPLYGLGDEETAYPSGGLTPSIGLSFGFAF